MHFRFVHKLYQQSGSCEVEREKASAQHESILKMHISDNPGLIEFESGSFLL